MFSANGLEVGIHQYFSACPGGIHGVRPSAKNYCALWHLRAAHGFSPGDPTVDFVIRLRPQKFRVGRDFLLENSGRRKSRLNRYGTS